MFGSSNEYMFCDFRMTSSYVIHFQTKIYMFFTLHCAKLNEYFVYLDDVVNVLSKHDRNVKSYSKINRKELLINLTFKHQLVVSCSYTLCEFLKQHYEI